MTLFVRHCQVKQIQTIRGGVSRHLGKYQIRLLFDDQLDLLRVPGDDALGQGEPLGSLQLQRVIRICN